MIVGTEMTVDEANWDAKYVQPNADAPFNPWEKDKLNSD